MTLTQIQLFVALTGAGSFTALAKQKGVSLAAISKQVSNLEKSLGFSLIDRNSKRLRLTDIGQLFLARAHKIVEEVSETKNILSQAFDKPSGTLRILAGRYFADKYILPFLEEFAARFPDVRLAIEVAERVPNVHEESVDVVFGLAHSCFNDLVCRKILETRHVVCASPAYLQKFGTPLKPQDLSGHRIISHQMRQPKDVMLFRDNQEFIVQPYLTLNDAGAMLDAAVNGVGVVTLGSYIVDDAIKQGLLVEVLSDYANSPRSVYMLYKRSRFVEPKVRSFVDFILEKLPTSSKGKKEPVEQEVFS